MKRLTKRHSSSPWCPVHRTRDPVLEAKCAYGDHQMHLHTGHVLLAKRGIAQAIICGHCAKPNRLVIAWDGQRWELAAQDQDQGQAAYPRAMDSEIH